MTTIHSKKHKHSHITHIFTKRMFQRMQPKRWLVHKTVITIMTVEKKINNRLARSFFHHYVVIYSVRERIFFLALLLYNFLLYFLVLSLLTNSAHVHSTATEPNGKYIENYIVYFSFIWLFCIIFCVYFFHIPFYTNQIVII